MAITEKVRELLVAVLETEDAFIYDVEDNGGVVRVLVDAEGGIGIDDLQRISRQLSRSLDAQDPIARRYTLEVSSPGLERPLRRFEHFRAALGEQIKLKTLPTNQAEGARRLQGELRAADDSGFEIQTDAGCRRLHYHEVSKVRTVFEWGPTTRLTNQRLKNQSGARVRELDTTNMREAPTL